MRQISFIIKRKSSTGQLYNKIITYYYKRKVFLVNEHIRIIYNP